MDTPKKLKILFLEDDEDTRELVRFTLTQSGMNMVAAETRHEAWDLAQKGAFDLYLLDGLLPNGDSLQLCRDLRKFTPKTPVVFYSGLAHTGNIRRGFDAGCDDYLVKPFFGDLAARLHQAAERRAHLARGLPDYTKVYKLMDETADGGHTPESSTEKWATVKDDSWEKYFQEGRQESRERFTEGRTPLDKSEAV